MGWVGHWVGGWGLRGNLRGNLPVPHKMGRQQNDTIRYKQEYGTCYEQTLQPCYELSRNTKLLGIQRCKINVLFVYYTAKSRTPMYTHKLRP